MTTSTKFEAKEIRTSEITTNTKKVTRTSFNVYANGVLCGRLTMTPEQFDEFTDRMRSIT